MRADATNPKAPRSIPRSRRLLPNPPSAKRRAALAARHEVVTTADDDDAEPTLARTTPPAAPALPERWSVRLELGDDDIAKLYGQGMTRGAVVWKKGMVEWRPLLITPELGGLLRRTRTTLIESPPAPPIAEEVTLPRPPRVPAIAEVEGRPLQLPLAESAPPPSPPSAEAGRYASVAPAAFDVEPARRSGRRGVELAAVAVAAFSLAWLTHSRFQASSAPVPVSAASVAAPASAPACEPTAPARSDSASTSSGIPTIAVADLPLAGRGASANVLASMAPSPRSGTTGSRAAREVDSSRPSRSDLVAALGQVAHAAGSCGERGGPARVVITFAPSGVARSIQVSGSALPSQTRSCIIAAAARARVPAFSGEPVTVSKTL
jgi:hypothetical protein